MRDLFLDIPETYVNFLLTGVVFLTTSGLLFFLLRKKKIVRWTLFTPLFLVGAFFVQLCPSGQCCYCAQAECITFANTDKYKMKKVSRALDIYFTDMGFYPKSLEDLLENLDGRREWGPDPYVKKDQLIDFWGRIFRYQSYGDGFVLKTFGRYGLEGGRGDEMDLVIDTRL